MKHKIIPILINAPEINHDLLNAMITCRKKLLAGAKYNKNTNKLRKKLLKKVEPESSKKIIEKLRANPLWSRNDNIQN